MELVLETLSYAGGTNAAGTAISQGGFKPILAVFDSTGAIVGQNDDGEGLVPADPLPLACTTYLPVNLTSLVEAATRWR